MLYRVTQVLDQAALIEFLNSKGQVGIDIEAFDASTPAPIPPEPAPKARPKRGSKVNEAILNALRNHAFRSVPQLKEALVDAGMASGSLSTGLAQLQKEGLIMRNQEGEGDGVRGSTYMLVA